MTKTWKILSAKKNLPLKDLIKTLLVNRGLVTQKDQENFLSLIPPSRLRAKLVGIDTKEISRAIARIKKAMKNQEQIVIYGDYDCDGICATAILWETLFSLGAKVLPFIPDRVEEGYGLSTIGLDNLKEKIPETKLVITVDHGIVAVEQVKYAQEKLGFDVIITDHHTKGKKLPKALAIVHTTSLSGAGISWFVANEIKKENNNLDLAALGTIADLVPLQGANRSIAKYGLEEIHKTKRVGLLALIREAGLTKEVIDTYEVSYILAPRLNALGRIDNALDALRLLCTGDVIKSVRLARRLNEVNGKRQKLTEETTLHAKEHYRHSEEKLIFISHETYNQGVIGLVAGRLVEEFYRPAIVVARSKDISKGSARSISGFNIVEAIRTFSDLLIDVGGHPMAAGFTVETDKLELLEEKLTKLADEQINDELLTKTLKIDCLLDLSQISFSLYEALGKLRPYGVENPEPVFSSEVEVVDTRLVGTNGKHLKLRVKLESLKTPRGWRGNDHDSPEVERLGQTYDAIAFNLSSLSEKINPGDRFQIAYTIALDRWQGNKRLQLKIKDIKISDV